MMVFKKYTGGQVALCYRSQLPGLHLNYLMSHILQHNRMKNTIRFLKILLMTNSGSS